MTETQKKKFAIEKEMAEIPRVLRQRKKISLEKVSSKLEEPILVTGLVSSLDLPGSAAENLADKLGINLKVRPASEVSKFSAKTVIAISFSGETEETVRALRETKAKVKIAITANKNSTLAKHANYIIPLICGEQASDSPTKSVSEEYYIINQLLSERFGKYNPISNKEIKQIEKNLKKEFSEVVVDKLSKTKRVIVIGGRGLADETKTKFEEVSRIPAEAIHGPLLFYSTIEVLTQGETILVADPKVVGRYKNILEKSARSGGIFYADKLGIRAYDGYSSLMRYAGLLKLITQIGKMKSVDLDHPEIFIRTLRGFIPSSYSGVKKIVVIGGGSGIPPLIKTLKKRGHNVCGITSMVDSGGSAGRLRADYNVMPPGDIRRIIASLSDHALASEIMNYRFKGGELEGHTLGNVMITALEKISSFKYGKEELERMIGTKGKALPATLDGCHLHAKLENGQTLKHEHEIDIPLRNPFLKINKVWLDPPAEIFLETQKVILDADIIIIGPGDLYSSLIPNFLIKGMNEAIKKSKAKKVYIVNAMTKLGETVGYSVADFVNEVEKYLGKNILDYVIYNQRVPSKERIGEFQKEEPFVFDYVKFDRKRLSKSGRPNIIGADLLTTARGPIVHDMDVLSKLILSLSSS